MIQLMWFELSSTWEGLEEEAPMLPNNRDRSSLETPYSVPMLNDLLNGSERTTLLCKTSQQYFIHSIFNTLNLWISSDMRIYNMKLEMN